MAALVAMLHEYSSFMRVSRWTGEKRESVHGHGGVGSFLSHSDLLQMKIYLHAGRVGGGGGGGGF